MLLYLVVMVEVNNLQINQSINTKQINKKISDIKITVLTRLIKVFLSNFIKKRHTFSQRIIEQIRRKIKSFENKF